MDRPLDPHSHYVRRRAVRHTQNVISSLLVYVHYLLFVSRDVGSLGPDSKELAHS